MPNGTMVYVWGLVGSQEIKRVLYEVSGKPISPNHHATHLMCHSSSELASSQIITFYAN